MRAQCSNIASAMGDCRSQSEDEPSDTDDLEFYPYPEDDALAAFDAHVYQQLNRRPLFQHDTHSPPANFGFRKKC